METSTPRRRGRPRAFDERQVLEAVLETFWERGYAGASLDDLARAAGVTRPSLYTAMGDKKSMYLAALEHFGNGMRVEFATLLNSGARLSDGLLAAYLSSIELYTSAEGPNRGCLAVCTASAESFGDNDIRRLLAELVRDVDEAFTERFRVAVVEGQLPATIDVAAHGRLAGAVLHSLAVRARAGADRHALEEFARAASDMLSLSAR